MSASRDKWGSLKRAFRLPVSRKRIESELGDEFRFHIEERTEQFIANGMSREDAEREVQKRFGNYEEHWRNAKQIDEDTMNQRNRSDFVRMLWREMQHSTRVLLRAPGFSFIAFITLALGIGATTAIYTVVDAVVLRPLPYPDSEQLVSILHPATVPGSGERKWGLSEGGYFQFRTNNHTMSSVGMYNARSMVVTNGGGAEIVRIGVITPSVFDAFKATATYGRLFSESDGLKGAPKIAVLSYEYLQRHFGGDATIVGTALTTPDESFEIVGVANAGLTLPMPGPFASNTNLAGFGVDVWLPLLTNEAGPFENHHPYVGIGRLKPGVSVEQAQAEFSTLFKNINEILPQVYSTGFLKRYNFRVQVAALKESVLGPTVPRALWMVLGSVLLVLVIATANVANLFIVRMEVRRREAAVRTALGASKVHLAAHYLSESLLLCIAAGFAGIALCQLSLKALLVIAPTDVPRLHTAGLSLTSIGVASAIALVTGIVLGVLPLFRKFELSTLRDGGRGMTNSSRTRVVRNGLVVGQVALALVLLAAAGLMLRSFERLRSVKPGFDPKNVFAFDISLPLAEYDTREKAFAFHREFEQRLRAISGVQSVGSTQSLPLEDFGTGCSVVFRPGQPYTSTEDTPCVATPPVMPGFFNTLKIAVRGRVPTWDDVDQRTHAAVVTRALANRLWPNESPINKGINMNGWQNPNAYRIVGVIDSLRAESLDRAPTEAVFVAPTGFVAGQRSDAINDVEYVIRTTDAGAADIGRHASEALKEINSRVPFVNPRRMEDVVSHSMARTTFVMILLGIASTIALLLSAVGIYGVIAYVVAQRRTEIGIRMALGATVTNVARMIVKQSVSLALLGIAIGSFGAYATGQALTSLLFEVSPADPGVFIAVALVLLLIAMMASFIPARRASRITPVEAMRSE